MKKLLATILIIFPLHALAVGMSSSGSNYINLPNPAQYPVTTQFTAAAWVRIKSTAASQIILAWGNGSNNGPHIAFITTNIWRIGIWGGTSCDSNNPVPVINQWTFVAGTFDGATEKIYVNGVLKNSCAVTPAAATAPVAHIGSDPNSGSFNMNGSIYNAQIFNRALYPSEIKALMYGTYVQSPSSGAMGNWLLNGNLLSFWPDLTGNHNNSTSTTGTVTMASNPPLGLYPL